jgi:N-acetylglucosaminyl-diphospho-decaprenol L-rhamnosyltransferase
MLSIIIVTRNTAELLAGLLTSIRQDVSLRPLLREIIVVDNASTDGTDQLIDQNFPEVHYLPNVENRGFAAAANQAVPIATGDFLLFLNSDTRLLPGELEKVLASMKDEATIGIAGPQLVYEDMRLQRSFANAPSLLLEVVPLFILELIFPVKYGKIQKESSLPTEVESVIGAALFVRAHVLRILRGFDERFFFFLEETDLCVRARQSGYSVFSFPSARVIHLQGKTVRQTWVKGRIEYAISLYKFIKKYHSDPYYRAFLVVRVIKSLLFLIVATLLPFLLFSESTRKKYAYYGQLILWHLKGLPDDAGLRSSSLK